MKHILLLSFTFAQFAFCFAQGVKISPTPGTPDPSAGLDVDFTNKGVVFPRMTTTQRLAISNPATGLLVYQTDAPEGFWYNGGTPASPNWVQVIQNPVNTNVDMSNNFIQNLPLPINNSDAVNKAYVDALVASGGGGTPVGIPTMMSNESGSQLTLSQAVQYCETLNESGHTDWRLPTVDELAYFYGSVNNTNYVWTKTLALTKENPLNQNYISARLSDGKWRAGGEVTSLFIARTASGTSSQQFWTTVATFTASNPQNVFIPVKIRFTVNAGGCGNSSQGRLKYNYADGSVAFSNVYSTSCGTITAFDETFPLNSVITPIQSIELQGQWQSTGSVSYTHGLTVSGYEVAMSQLDGATLFVRCVR